MTKERIGFIGAGLMGHGMAHNLVTKGWPLTVLAHRKREAVEALVAEGAAEAADHAALAAASDVIILCLTDSRAVESAVAALEPHLPAGMLLIDASTADPVSTLALGDRLHPRRIGLVDAPLGRTPKEAWAGTLDMMVGADDRDWPRAEPILAAMAARVMRIGGPGAGHRMKLVNNFLSLGYGALYAEAITLARRSGIDVETFDRVIRGGRMDCGFYQTFMGYAKDGDRDAHRFTISNAHKDLRYVESMAAAAPVAAPIAAAARNAYQLALARGFSGGEDYLPHMVEAIGEANGLGRLHPAPETASRSTG